MADIRRRAFCATLAATSVSAEVSAVGEVLVLTNEPMQQVKRKKKKQPEPEQINLLAETAPSDEGELLGQHISYYRRVQDYGD